MSTETAPRVVKQSRLKEPVSAGFFVVTISDTRLEADDVGGRTAMEWLTLNGHRVAGYRIVKDEPDQIRALLAEQAGNPEVQIFLLTGGTGISRRDNTFDAVRALFDAEIVGFGELFRSLSYEEIGSPAMLSRATAGLLGGKALFSLPGSPAAVRLGMEKLVLPETGHILQQLKK